MINAKQTYTKPNGVGLAAGLYPFANQFKTHVVSSHNCAVEPKPRCTARELIK